MTERVFRQGETVYREGEKGTHYYHVLSGSVAVTASSGKTGEQRLTELHAGDYFGEMAVLAGQQRVATVTALEDTRLQELDVHDLNDDLTGDPERICGLIRLLGSRIRALSGDYVQLCDELERAKAEGGKPRALSLLDRARIAVLSLFGGSRAETAASEESLRSGKENAAPKIAAYDKGTVIYREGEPGACMYEVNFGRVGVFANYGTDREQKLTELSANQFFGEMGLLEGEPRSATVVVLEDNTTLETIGMEDLRELFRRNPSEVWMILDHTARRLRTLTEDYFRMQRELEKRT